MKMRAAITILTAAALGLSACAQTDANAPATRSDNGLAPPGAPKGTCWGKISSPAVVQSVTKQVLVTPAKTNPDGTVAELPVYRSEDRQEIVTPRRDRWFETPCPPAFTVEFVSSLQRALQVRGLYSGPVTGAMDRPTRNAVRAVQKPRGLDSDILTIQTARDLGLVIVKLPQVAT